ncbi:PLD nuclease N-terminal domain-containing protein [Microbacterium rhizophilus]|uniref:PLD nuclease N-terminal domain-containing protein n=1 Tax=Microbacterium rhizophilus TaxID=3138934 RepID=UPI0031E7C8CD
MARLLIVLGIAAVVFWVFSIVDCAVQSPSRHRGVSKGAWIAIVVLIPVLGGILWFVLGRARKQPPGRVVAPDDDPNFLGTLKGVSDQDERIRLLEEELARLDSETDEQPKPGDDEKPDEPNGDDDPRGRRGGTL